MSKPEPKFNQLNRIVALALALIWSIAGVLAGVLGILKGRWLLSVVGAVAAWYGLLWFRVVRKGRRLQWPKDLWP